MLGEQSNRGGDWRKFSQTFFLAEQPNGYFVLNDICRYLKEEGVDEETTAANSAEQPATVDSTLFDDSSFPPPTASTLGNGAAVEAAVEHEPIPEAFGEIEGDQQAAPLTNGVHHDEELESTVALPQEEEVVVPVEEPEVQPEAPVEEVAPASQPVAELQSEEKKEPEVAPVVAEPTLSDTPAPNPTVTAADKPKSPKVAAAPTPAPAPAPTPAPAPAPTPAPAAPKSWASLAASNSVKWGNQAVEKKGISSAAAPSPTPPAERATPAAAAAASRPLIDAVLAINSPLCFVKGVLEPVTDKALRDILTSRFGPIRELDIIRSVSCTVVDMQASTNPRLLISRKHALSSSLSESTAPAELFRRACGHPRAARAV